MLTPNPRKIVFAIVGACLLMFISCYITGTIALRNYDREVKAGKDKCAGYRSQADPIVYFGPEMAHSLRMPKPMMGGYDRIVMIADWNYYGAIGIKNGKVTEYIIAIISSEKTLALIVNDSQGEYDGRTPFSIPRRGETVKLIGLIYDNFKNRPPHELNDAYTSEGLPHNAAYNAALRLNDIGKVLVAKK